MKRWIIRARAVATEDRPLEDKLIVICGKRVESILPSSAASRFSSQDFISSQRYLVVPGLVDIHCHGGGGVDPNTRGGLLATAVFHASHGTAALLYSTFYTGHDDLFRMASLIKEVRSQVPLQLLGLHLEGPYLNPEARGAIPADTIRPCRPQDVPKILEAGQDEIKMVTVAPELPHAEGVIRAFTEAGVVVAMGHSLATAEEARQGVEWGATVVTHLGNAMRPFHQREPGLVGVGLSDPRLATEMIADGHHLAPETLAMFLRGKNGDALMVSDCRWVGGLSEADQAPDEDPLRIVDGAAHQPDGKLAGGIHPLWKGVTTVAGLPGFTIWDAIPLATVNPARVLGKKLLGRISVGGRADLVLAGPDYSVKRVLIGGEEIYRAAHE